MDNGFWGPVRVYGCPRTILCLFAALKVCPYLASSFAFPSEDHLITSLSFYCRICLPL
ncbi:hypothetical protein SERLADRAFT_365431 [Serpula lacrymans var. lacrymans S7.9]|uniref:Uncharacterized protein n=1 Tax=Serpula lacrymans var. lacrymans (strain S7.9) TaxID=578457 RepID=F8NGT0_SERL9|nr:uncharacterized protein SERLADRAFT_365431 [Serpula lacrymans var. lacrymans S7.9]EGO29412.1 hypothetical protein SERLADRAFT_365431 [Serpula lacrymans var. lacrymans S7.9]